MENNSGIVKEGWLKRVKNQKRRYFVLCFDKGTGAAQLQYYENEKKYQSNLEPKRTILLRDCLGIISKEDPKHGQVLVLYRRDRPFTVTSDSEESLQSWLIDLDKLHKMENQNLQESKYDLVWNVQVISRGLGGVKNMTGPYKLCLKDETLYFVSPCTQDVFVEEKLCHIRRYGHMDHCFFMEFGRSTTLGAGEVWMEVEDPLIAQKIHETLSRSVKQPASIVSGDVHNNSKKTKTHRHSFHIDHVNHNNNNNNNDPSPKSRRSTFMSNVSNVLAKVKETTRPHSKSISGNGYEEHEIIPNNESNFVTYMNQPAQRLSDEDERFAHIVPPIPSAPRRTSKSSLPGLSESISSIDENKGSTTSDSKSLNGSTKERTRENEYTELKPKRRSVTKQNCGVVRMGYAAEQRRARSLPRRPSDSSERELRSSTSKTGDSDKESADGEERRHSFDLNPYGNLGPFNRTRMTSDSSLEESIVAPRDPLDDPQSHHYTPMRRLSRPSSAISHGSSHCTDEPAFVDEDSLYINMSPGKDGVFRPTRKAPSSNGSNEDDSFAITEETFDHLSRDDTGQRHGDGYVDMRPRSECNRALKKTNSDSQRAAVSDYVNVSVNRSQSVGSKSSRPRPVFEIVPETRTGSDDEIGRHPPSNYVNIQTKNSQEQLSASDPDLQYANCAPVVQMSNDSEARRSPALNYASVSFAEESPAENGSPRSSRLGRKSPSNYSKIDFQKSRGLAEISSSRERQLQGIH